jgi:hypothetical protein
MIAKKARLATVGIMDDINFQQLGVCISGLLKMLLCSDIKMSHIRYKSFKI